MQGDEELRGKVWTSLTPQERDEYCGLPPGASFSSSTSTRALGLSETSLISSSTSTSTPSASAPTATGMHKERDRNNIDLDKYDPQPLDASVATDHFGLVLIEADHVDYLSIPPVVTEDLKPRHRESPRESLLQANKIPKRFLHTRNSETGTWHVVRVNP